MIGTLPRQQSTRAATAPATREETTARGNGKEFGPKTSPRTVRHAVRDDQICVVTFDRPDSAANIFDCLTLLELGEELEFIARNPELRGVIFTSAKPAIFIAGADLKSMSAAESPEQVRKLVELGQEIMNRVAELEIPTVAAIHGAAAGGGYELCLACDYRVASTDRATKIGLPEVLLGLVPAWGGTTRLPRLIGLPKALDVILAGKMLAAKPALKCGMVDELAPAEYVIDVAARLIARGKSKRPPRRLVNNRLVASIIGARLRPLLRKKTRGHYPAVLKALAVATRGLSRSIDGSLALEREAILELMQGETCRNLINVFLLQEQAKKRSLDSAAIRSAATNGASLPSIKPIARTAVIGSGVMGAGIAQWLSGRQLSVILRDVNTEQLAKGMAGIAKIYQDAVKRHRLSPIEARQGLDRIYPAPLEVPLRNVDLVIEAAVEKLEAKKIIFQRLDELSGEDTLLATNTSALPISELAAATRRPERVLGLHFFNPVHRMQLVEIVAARQTSRENLQRALRFVQQIGKLPVVVKDSPGFLVNRILMPYLIEAGNLFAAGADIRQLDEAMLEFGMPMGPMLLLDEVGIDVALHVAQTLAAHYRDRMIVPETLNKMVRAGLLGRKSGSGFYIHAKGKKPQPNPQVADYHSATTAGETRNAKLETQNLAERMVLLMINEAARCLEEEVVREPADVDFAMIMGTGFAPFRGGPLRYADSIGAGKLTSAMDRLVESGAGHFEPCALLRNMAIGGKRFYPNK